MRKIFYNPETLEIKGMSDGEVSMSFPFLETDKELHSLSFVRIVTDKKGKLKLDIYG